MATKATISPRSAIAWSVMSPHAFSPSIASVAAARRSALARACLRTHPQPIVGEGPQIEDRGTVMPAHLIALGQRPGRAEASGRDRDQDEPWERHQLAPDIGPHAGLTVAAQEERDGG